MRKYVQPPLGFFTEGHGSGRKVHPISIRSSATGRERLSKKRTKLKLPKDEKPKAERKDARLGSFRGVGAQRELTAQKQHKKPFTMEVAGRTAIVAPVPADHSKLSFFTWSDEDSAQAVADAINSWKGKEVVVYGGGGSNTALARVKGAKVRPPAKIPPEGYDGWAVKMDLEYLAGDDVIFKQYDSKAGRYVVKDFTPWYGSWRIAKVEGWEDGKPVA